MSFLFHSGQAPQYTGLSTQTSSNAVAVSIVMGKNRVASNIIWQGDFQQHKASGGKGGGGKGGGYTYSGSFQFGVCWGPSAGFGTVWQDQTITTLSALGMSSQLGTNPQSPWGYMVSEHPDQALGYAGICSTAISNLDMGDSNNPPQFNYEVFGRLYNTAPWVDPGGSVTSANGDALNATWTWAPGGDADVAQCIELFLSDPTIGIGFDIDFIEMDSLMSTDAATGAGDNALQTYARAMGWGFSPVLNDQQAGSETMQRWMDVLSTMFIWTGYSVRFLPRSAETITGNGVTYLPAFPVVYTIDDTSFIYEAGKDPLNAQRGDPRQAKNQIDLTIKDRSNQYNDLPLQWQDITSIELYGPLPSDSIDSPEICNIAIGMQMVALYGQWQAYVRNRYTVKLPVTYMLLEPGDVVVLVDPVAGPLTAMIEEITEETDGTFTVVALEWNESVTHLPVVESQSVLGNNINTGLSPDPVNPPTIFEPVATLASGQIWAAVSGGSLGVADVNWGGCNVWISTDDATYEEIGTMTAPSRMGALTAALAAYTGANPDTGETLAVNLTESGGTLVSASSPSDAEAGSTLCIIVDSAGTYELVSFQTSNLTGLFAYSLTDLYRGLYGSAPAAHASGAHFARLDDEVFKYDLPTKYIGVPLWLKFQSFNIIKQGLEDLSTCTAYTFTPSGASYGTGVGGTPATPDVFSVAVGVLTNTLTVAPAPANDAATSVQLYRAPGLGSTFSTAVEVVTAPGNATSITDATAQPATPYTYFAVTTNAAGQSVSAGQNVTTGAGTGNIWTVPATGTGASQAITLPYSGLITAQVSVFVNGLRYPTSSYTISGATLTMTSNAAGDVIEILGLQS